MDASQRPRPRRRRGGVIALFVVGVILAAAAGGAVGFSRYLKNCRASAGAHAPVDFTIPSGATGDEVVSSLVGQGVMRCPSVVRWDLRKRGLASAFEAGDYQLTTNMTLDQVLTIFAGGQKVVTVSVTLPEGWTAEQMVPELSQRLHVPPGDLHTEMERGRTIAPYLPSGHPIEGFLFPKTYEFPKVGLTATTVVDAMTDQFRQEVRKLNWGAAKRLHVTPYEVVTIASMIEREAQVPSERSKVAAVIYNRLNMRGEPLGIDATLAYVDPNPADGLTDSDLKIDSPYNTRTNLGLPPTPIANPGLASIKAALNPAKTNDWLYVLCSDDGHHAFTDSYSEFLQLKSSCL